MRERILNVIYESIDVLNEGLESHEYLRKDEASSIFGRSKIDSLAFINFVVSIEENIDKEFGQKVDLMGENVLLSPSNPFRTVGTLCSFIEEYFDTAPNKHGNVDI